MASETYEQRVEQATARAVKAAFVPAPTGGAFVDAEARAAINAIRQLLIDEKLMKPATE